MSRGAWAVVSVLLLATGAARAEWVRGEGKWLFGPDLSERYACEMADRKAREAAIREVTGEKLTSEDLLVCKEQKNEAECNLNRYTWSTIDGEIRGIRDRREEATGKPGGLRQCTVTLEADVAMASGQPDPNFDMTVRLNRKTFRHGESLEISIVPTQPMYVSVFQWLPYEKTDRQILRIFPNSYDQQNHFTVAATVPTKEGDSVYEMGVAFPEGLQKKTDLVDEYLMVIGTRSSVSFRESYALDEFKARLLEIPRRDWRQVKKAYNVVKPE